VTTTEVATLVDSNMLLDIVRTGSVWSSWSGQALARVADEGPVVINSIIYPEVSATYATVEEADVVLVGPAFVRAEVPWPAAFLACGVTSSTDDAVVLGLGRCRNSSSERMPQFSRCDRSPEIAAGIARTFLPSRSSLR